MKKGRVYKIVSPENRIYVGSTIRKSEDRWKDYKTLNCKSQIRLYNSFIKYGVRNHIFKQIWEGPIEEMLKMESILGRLYNVLDREKGLNSQLPKESDKYSCVNEDTRIKMSNSAKNKPPISEETRRKMSESLKNPSLETRTKISNSSKGRTHTQETKDKISKKHKGKKLSKEHIELIRKANKGKQLMLGKKHSNKTKEKISIAKTGIKQSLDHRNKLDNARKKPIIQMDLEGNFIREWDSAIDIEKELKINKSRISECCKEKRIATKFFKFKYKQNE